MNIKNKQKGFSLYLMITMMAILMAIVFGLSTIIIGGVKLAILSGDSIKAFYVADSGIEEALYRINIEGETGNFSGSFSVDGYDGSYSVVISSEGDNITITSTGAYREARKRIEVSITGAELGG